MNLHGGIAVVTGAAGGIGLALAEESMRRGSHVVITDIDADKLATAVGNDSFCS
jgi:NAD(P)-dependent dehydrogenase (short-subunit alcohol dehydrogenase family)